MSNTRTTIETRFQGIPVSGGIAVGKVCLFNESRHNKLALYKVSGEGKQQEKDRVRRALDVSATRLVELIDHVAEQIGPAEAKIFEAQQMIMGDSKLVARIFRQIDSLGLNAEAAITQTLDGYEARLLEVDNEYIKERATDIGEIRRRLLDVLGNMRPSFQCADDLQHCQKGRDRIVVAEELTAGLTVELDPARTWAFVTERGGPTSHAAILARAMGVPAVCGIKNIHQLLSCGTELLVNGDTGEVLAWPSEEKIAEALSGQIPPGRGATPVEPVDQLTVLANISRVEDAAEAVRQRAEGVGLYRTEFEFLSAGRPLTEDEQVEHYRSVVRTMEGLPVCFRLLDIGGDKAGAFLDIPREDNPHLGLRGSRLLLEYPDLLASQARAITRVARDTPVDVLYPMVIDLEQFLKLRALFDRSVADLPPGRLRHGVMFEVPSACLEARELLEEADFGSVGTNDLVQYLFAVDRNNELVAADYTPDKPVFWSLLARLAEAARATGRDLSVCGEVAGVVRFLPKLMELGLTTLSVSPRLIPQVRLAAEEGVLQ